MIDTQISMPDGSITRVRKVSPLPTRRGAEQYEREVREAILAGARERGSRAASRLRADRRAVEEHLDVVDRGGGRRPKGYRRTISVPMPRTQTTSGWLSRAIVAVLDPWSALVGRSSAIGRVGLTMSLLAACRVGIEQPDFFATEPHGAVTSPTSTDQPSLVAEPDDATDRPTGDEAPVAVAASEPLVVLEPDARWPVVTTPIAAAHDGRGWIGAIDHGLVVYDDTGEVQRFEGAAFGDDQLAAIPHGRWVVGARILDVDGRVRFDGYSWCNQLGRFATCRASAFSPDGTIAILAASNQPSTCLRDRGCPHSSSWQGVLARMTFEAESFAPKVRVLVEHEDRRDFVVAASERRVAAVEGRLLSIWPAVGDDEPLTVTLEGGAPSRLAWLGDDLVGARWVDTERTELVVLDGAHGYTPAARWMVEGRLEAMAVRPGGGWIAIGTSWYRARATIEVDINRIEVYAPDGIRHARIELDDTPTSVSWSPKGDALFVTIPGNESEPRVIRYVVRG